MTAFLEQDVETLNIQTDDLFQILEELNDPKSPWHRITLAEMPGQDYIFLPHNLCNGLQELYTIEALIDKLQQFLSSSPKRTILIGVEMLSEQIPLFEKLNIHWSDHIAINWKRERILPHSDEYEFTHTLFQHSEPLVLKPQY